MLTFVTIFHVVVSLALILIVLLQTGKGADMGATFGGSSQTLFGARGPQSFLGKLTTGAAVFFMVTSLGLTILSTQKDSTSVIADTPPAATEAVKDATPAADPVESAPAATEEAPAATSEEG